MYDWVAMGNECHDCVVARGKFGEKEGAGAKAKGARGDGEGKSGREGRCCL